MSVFVEDYIGFTYNNVHSSELGIVRVSDGSRFNENLLPTMQDKTTQVPGGDGTYYFGSYYTQRQFSISFAFDALTEAGIARLKRHFGDKKIHDLIFDETPYKIYSAKVTGTASIKYLVFDEGSGRERIYKGEGSIQFTCYNPFARNNFSRLTSTVKEAYPNWREWEEASGLNIGTSFNMVESKNGLTIYDQNTKKDVPAGQDFPLYNPGDQEANFTFRIYSSHSEVIDPSKNVKMYLSTDPNGSFLEWEPLPKNNAWITISSKTNLFEEKDSNDHSTGKIYNDHIVGGSFFKIPITKDANLETAPRLKFDNMKFKVGNSHLRFNYYYY